MSKPNVLLEWQINLRHTQPKRLPVLLGIILMAGVCVWGMFQAILPVLVAILLLLGAVREYILPLHYRITNEGVFVTGFLVQNELLWKDAKRCFLVPHGIVITPLAQLSRLDNFRGVCLRFASDGEMGDKASVLAIIHKQPSLTLT